MTSKLAHPVDVASLEEKLMSTVHAFVNVAVDLGTSVSCFLFFSLATNNKV
jgi:hypothetical protein